MLGHLGESLLSDDFMPHGMCFLWRPELLWLHAASDGLIALAYYSIPVALLYFVLRRRDLVFPGTFLLFGAFIFACGTTHVMAVWTLWRPDYWVDGGIKVATAAVSLAAAGLLWRIVPAALALPGRAELVSANRALETLVGERSRAAEQARQANAELEQRVAERTADLEAANARLRVTLAEREALLQELQHRVRNNLQIVAGILKLQARNAPAELGPRLDESLERVRAMARAHEQVYRAEGAGSIALDTLVRDICQDLGHEPGAPSHGRVECRLEAEGPSQVPLEAATPVALIVNEAVANAYRHAFPEGRGGEIVVAVGPGRVAVRDDGVGLGVDPAKAQSTGLRLIRMLAAQIGADAIWTSTPAGTTFGLTFRNT